MSNDLSNESSPYLLQHAANPVHWKAWSNDTLETAANSQKLIIISIGYSACHWCHVMEHETFEDDDAAEVMNRHFINIKVDREERPDIDAVYMKSVQIMTGRGGWPMNVVALPDGRPVWGGTYFRKEEWIGTLEELRQMYESQPEKLTEYAAKLHQAMNSISLAVSPIAADTAGGRYSLDPIAPLVEKWSRSFDNEYGGMAKAPKFMMPSNYQFLMRYAVLTKNDELLKFVNLTLTKMAYGGLFDTVGGGFSRYSVDMRWHIPHFEKMLYDNAQLLSLYSNAYKLTRNVLYREVAEKTIQFISSEFSNDAGGFYSALDADSLTADGKLEEGAFYVWTKQELSEILQADFDLFSDVFNVGSFGYWEHQNYVLIRSRPLSDIASTHGISEEQLRLKKAAWETLLFEKRTQRKKPRLDDKCLTSWNAMALNGFVHAFNATGTIDYLDVAKRNARFIKNTLWNENGALFHTYKDGNARINGYLEDYAHVIDAFITLYQATLLESWLNDARQLADYCLENFYEETSGFFSFTSRLDAALVSAHFETEDNVIPASNSVMASNLFKLGIYFNNSAYTTISEKMTTQVVPGIDYPSAFSNWLNCYLDLNESVQLAIVGKEAANHVTEINREYLPHVLIAGSSGASALPFLSGKSSDGATQYFICRGKTCSLPSGNFSELTEKLAVLRN